jgi:hypothetical protein
VGSVRVRVAPRAAIDCCTPISRPCVRIVLTPPSRGSNAADLVPQQAGGARTAYEAEPSAQPEISWSAAVETPGASWDAGSPRKILEGRSLYRRGTGSVARFYDVSPDDLRFLMIQQDQQRHHSRSGRGVETDALKQRAAMEQKTATPRAHPRGAHST